MYTFVLYHIADILYYWSNIENNLVQLFRLVMKINILSDFLYVCFNSIDHFCASSNSLQLLMLHIEFEITYFKIVEHLRKNYQ